MLTVAGPLSWDHVVVIIPGGFGRPSSIAVAERFTTTFESVSLISVEPADIDVIFGAVLLVTLMVTSPNSSTRCH